MTDGGENWRGAALEESLLPEEAAARTGKKYEKTYLDVLGVCCSAEVALVERLLAPLDGVRAVSVVVPSRTVIVEHDPEATSQSRIGNPSHSSSQPKLISMTRQLTILSVLVCPVRHGFSVKVLNGAGLEASVRAYGSSGIISRWPSPYIVACGVLLLASSFSCLLPPLRWLALGAACAGAPPMILRGFAAASRLTLDINLLMLIAVAGAVALKDYTEAGAIVFLFTTAEWLETLACTKVPYIHSTYT
jgi:Cd2+/Zn2+-exporting ATPase